MKKIGVLFGMENTFPGALVERINAMDADDIRAEFVHVGGVQMDAPCPYAVIVDRVSHDVPFYRAYLKNAVLSGAVVINNPFWWSADDKFFNYALASKLGVAVPRTVLLPHKLYPPHTTEHSMRNLEFPLDWERIFDYVKFPAFLKPHDGGGWRDVYEVGNPREFFEAYDRTGDLCMTLQAAVPFQQYFRCFVVGQKEVRAVPYDPRRPHHERYVKEPQTYPAGLLERVERDALTLCRALGYDLNTVEFAVADGVPYAIDFMNPAPDADRHALGAENFAWIVDKVAELAIQRTQEAGTPSSEFHWSRFLAGGASVGEAKTRTKAPAAAKRAVKTASPRSAVKKKSVERKKST